MADLKLIEKNETLEKAHWVIFLRYIALAITVFAGTTWAILANGFPQFISFGLSLGSFVLLYNIAGHLYLKRKEDSLSPRKVIFLCFFQLLADVVVITFLIHVTGGILSPFIVMYFFPILIISMVHPEKPFFAIVLGLFVILLYESLLCLEFGRILLPISIINQGKEIYQDFDLTLYYMIVLPSAIIIAAFLASIIARYLTKGKEDLKQRIVTLNKFRLKLEKTLIERKQAKDELIRFSAAVNISIDGVIICDINGNVLDINEAVLKKHGIHQKADMIGKKALEFIIPEDRGKVHEAMRKLMQKGYITAIEYNIITKDGGKIPVEANGVVMKDKDGKPIGFVTTVRDITEREQARGKLEGKIKEFEEFHDLAVGRELKMVELEKEVNALLAELGHEPKYKES